MGVVSVTQEFSAPNIPHTRMFNALVLDAQNLLPKLMPINNIVIISGEGGPGTIEEINFTDSSPFKYVKNRLDVVDIENFRCKYTFIEGDVLGDKFEFITYDVKYEASGDGGCVSKMVTNYHTKEGIEIKEEEIEAGKEQAMEMFKVAEAYLTENPHVCA